MERSAPFAPEYNRCYRIAAPAKINVRLKVTGRQANGYHLLSMLNLMIDLCDQIDIEVWREGGLEVVMMGDDEPVVVPVEQNTAWHAARLFLQRFAIDAGARIAVQKRIPAGAGLGGGSSDAAAVLRFLSRFFEMEQREDFAAIIREIALEIGADVPYFLGGGAAAVRGIGEQVESLTAEVLHGWPCVVVTPKVQLATPAVYAAHRALHAVISAVHDSELDQFCADLQGGCIARTAVLQRVAELCANDLEGPACGLCPKVGELLRRLRAEQSWIVGMTGSGSAVFVLPCFEHLQAEELREAVALRIAELPVRIQSARTLANSLN